ncbi:MAG: alpha/beta hydrolase family protein [Thermoguttaceae bacterium]
MYRFSFFVVVILVCVAVVRAESLGDLRDASETTLATSPQSLSREASELPSPVGVRTVRLTLTVEPGPRRINVKVYRPVQASSACPVILVSHGLGGSQNDCGYLGAAWASRGFVSIHIRHQEVSEGCRDERVRPLVAYKDAYQKYWTGRTITRDITAVLNWLTRNRNGDEQTPESLIGVAIDTDSIGVSGYNLGALASLMLAGQTPPDGGPSLADARIKAVVSLGAPVYPTNIAPRQLYQTIDRPVLFVAGTNDDSVVGMTKGPQRRIPFDMAPPDLACYLLTLAGGDHQIYSGNRMIGSGENDAAYHAAMARATMLFWTATLMQNREAEATLAVAAERRGFMGVGRVETRGTATNAGELASASKNVSGQRRSDAILEPVSMTHP